jgi:hypothetical protein
MSASPINTFPDKSKDSERVLLFGWNSLTPEDDDEHELSDSEWHIGCWYAADQYFRADGDGYIVNVSHWMPLPAPPKT